ncbi:hypothetical protein FWK35_00005606, partial [Aphis craccivora]
VAKYFFGLPYLNPNDIPDTFTETILITSELNNSLKITNGAENFHSHFNIKIPPSGLTLLDTDLKINLLKKKIPIEEKYSKTKFNLITNLQKLTF